MQNFKFPCTLVAAAICACLISRASIASPVTLLPLPIPDDPEEIHKALGDFQHAPYDAAGCWLLSLPFRYTNSAAAQQSPDRSEADAFAFLMSADRDWIPGNYCSRHAYFVFEREAGAMQYLAKRYDNDLIARSCKFWHATAAVGGELHRTGKGIGGTVELYDSRGTLTFSKAFQPRESARPV